MMIKEFFFLLTILTVSIHGWGNNKDKVLLEKVTSITLEEGKMTNARRSSAIRQLECVGGSAGCYGYRPKVVQCVNTGHDGYDVQWECKTEMDSKYRFGKIDVSCEGYDYPDDPYVLRGSCGLRYELDLTEEGHRQKKSNFYSDQHHHHDDYNSSSSGSSWFGSLIQLLIIGAVIYCCLGACFGRRSGSSSYSSSGHSNSGHGNSGPGFWSGAATGGAMGYMMGRRRGYGTSNWGSGWGSGGGWGSSGGGWGSSRSSHSSGSSSRSSSGYGGTSRR